MSWQVAGVLHPPPPKCGMAVLQAAQPCGPNGLQSVLEVEPAETEVGAGRDAKLPTPTSIAAFKADLKLALPKRCAGPAMGTARLPDGRAALQRCRLESSL